MCLTTNPIKTLHIIHQQKPNTQIPRMEGLIPLVCRALKKNKTRRQYQCLSSGVAQTYNSVAADLYNCNDHTRPYASPPQKEIHLGSYGHRRYKSVSDLSGGFSVSQKAAEPKQLVRFRSHRMFSCVTGA